MKTKIFLIFTVLLMLSTKVIADDKQNYPSFDIKLKPVLLDSKDNSSATIGVEYNLTGEYKKNMSGNEEGEEINSEVPIHYAAMSYKATGTVAGSKERNPKNFLDFLVNAKWLYSNNQIANFSGGLFVKYEADQSFENKQFVYGLRATSLKKIGVHTIGLDINYGRVDPKDDSERKAVLDGEALNPYYRWDFELVYLYEIKWKVIESIEFNYRYFIENNDSSLLKNAGLDTHQLTTLRVGLPNNMFVAYSDGKLPFDKKNDQIIEIGFSYNFK